MNAPNLSTLASPTDVARGLLNASAGSSSTLRTGFQPAGTGRTDVRCSTSSGQSKLDMMLVAGVLSGPGICQFVHHLVRAGGAPRFIVVTYASLIAYAIYSACVVWALYRFRGDLPHRALAWLDVAVAGYLVSLTDGTNSMFFFFFFFAIIWASFTRGFREGM